EGDLIRRKSQRAIAVRPSLAPLSLQLSEEALHIERVSEKAAILQLFRERQSRIRLERRLFRVSGLGERKSNAITRVDFRARIVDPPRQIPDPTAPREHLGPAEI